jgi:hypothetical protein
MPTATKVSADRIAYETLQSHLVEVEVGLGLTIEVYDLIVGRLLEGDRIDYFSGNAPADQIVIKFAEHDPYNEHLRRVIATQTGLVRDQYLAQAYDHAAAAESAIHDLPAAMVDDLNLLSGANWSGHVRLILNRLTMVDQDNASFPRTLGQFIGVCQRRLPIDHWREALVELKQRRKQIEACAPSRDVQSADVISPQPEDDGEIDNKAGYEEKAIAYFLHEVKRRPASQITKAEIIKKLGCDKSTLSKGRAPTLHQIMQAHLSLSSGHAIHKGSKDADGNLDAIGDLDIDLDALD